jgi:hypothetical protein
MHRLIALPLVILAGCNSAPADPFPPPANGLQIKTAPYTVEASSEKYFCYTKTVTQETAAIEVQTHEGTLVHHLAVFQTIVPEPDGFSECPSLIKETWLPLYGGGRNTGGMKLPDGAGFKFPKDAQILVQLHLVNATTHAVTETTTVNLVFGADPASLTPAGIYAVGNRTFTIPTGATSYPVVGQCGFNKKAPIDVFALFPHMHRLGRAIQLEHGTTESSAQPIFRVDPWSFGDQPMKMMNAKIVPGDFLRATCTYDNTDGHDIHYGESTFDEMCFVVLFYTPFDTLGACLN